MHNSLVIATLAGLGGMLGWGAADFFAKKAVDNIGAIRSLVWAHGCGTVLFILVALGQVLVLGRTVHMPDAPITWLGLVFFGVLQMIVYWLAYEGFGKGQLAVLNPVFASYSGVVALISIALLGEKATPLIIVGLFVVFGGVILLNVDLKGLKSKKLNIIPGLKEVGGAAALAAVWTLGWDKFVTGKDALAYALFMYAFMSLAAAVLAKMMKVGLTGVQPKLWKFLLLMGLGETIAYLAVSWGFSSSPRTSVVALVSGAFSVPAVLLAYAFLKERITVIQSVAVAGIVAGIILISIA